MGTNLWCKLAALIGAAALAGCAAPHNDRYVVNRDMFDVNPVAGDYSGYADYLARQYYAMGGSVPSDLSADYGRCLDRAYLAMLTPAEITRLDAAATRIGDPMAGAEKVAFEQRFAARVPAAKMEAEVRSICPDTATKVEQALAR